MSKLLEKLLPSKLKSILKKVTNPNHQLGNRNLHWTLKHCHDIRKVYRYNGTSMKSERNMPSSISGCVPGLMTECNLKTNICITNFTP